MSKKIVRFIFVTIFIWSIYHTIRDILQIFKVGGIFANVLSREHFWCKPYCDYVIFPPEIFNIIVIPYLLKKNKVGILGFIVFMTGPYVLWAWLSK